MEQDNVEAWARQLASGAGFAELRFGGVSITLRGRALRLILWIAGHQKRLNDTAPESGPESGQLWLTWKGNSLRSIDGDIKTKL